MPTESTPEQISEFFKQPQDQTVPEKSDAPALKEEHDFSTGDLERKSLVAAYQRDEELKSAFHWVVLIGCFVVFFIFLIGIILFAYDLFAPPGWRFWSDDQHNKVQVILLSVLASSVFQSYSQRILERAAKHKN
ncbi:MAG: hypothetical protein U1F68_14870 [Gammaproteobacteria bacterium]